MKNIITIDYFKNDFGYKGIDDQEITDDRIKFFIGLGSRRVESIIGRYVEKALAENYYIETNDKIAVNNQVITDPKELKEEESKLDAIKEAVALYTKFGVDTGYDFLTGSFSMSMGSESYSDSIDFESSLQTLERNIREMLANYDFNELLITSGSFAVEIEDSLNDPAVPPAWEYNEDRPLTEQGLFNRLLDPNWTTGLNGINIRPKDQTQPSLGIIIENTQAAGAVDMDDTEIRRAEAKYE